jgi:hypothetical protein
MLPINADFEIWRCDDFVGDSADVVAAGAPAV